MENGDAEAYLGLTDSIIQMIKFYRPCHPGNPHDTKIQNVCHNRSIIYHCTKVMDVYPSVSDMQTEVTGSLRREAYTSHDPRFIVLEVVYYIDPVSSSLLYTRAI